MMLLYKRKNDEFRVLTFSYIYIGPTKFLKFYYISPVSVRDTSKKFGGWWGEKIQSRYTNTYVIGDDGTSTRYCCSVTLLNASTSTM